MRIVIISMLIGCGTTHKIKGSTDHKAETRHYIDGRLVVGLDLESIKEFCKDQEDSIQCVNELTKSLTDLIEVITPTINEEFTNE